MAQRALRAQRDELYEFEINHAVKAHDMAHAWHLCRLLANTKKGSRRKRASMPPTFLPSKAQVLKQLSEPDAEGGLSLIHI